jgi:hypothetical protein
MKTSGKRKLCERHFKNRNEKEDLNKVTEHCRQVLYGCETWSLTVNEEHSPSVFERGVLK